MRIQLSVEAENRFYLSGEVTYTDIFNDLITYGFTVKQGIKTDDVKFSDLQFNDKSVKDISIEISNFEVFINIVFE